MKANLKIAVASVLVLLGLVVVSPLSVMGAQIPAQSEAYIQRQVLHQLRMLPYYTIFDDLSFRVQGDTVVLSGQVTDPVLKSDAAGVLKRIEGVRRVVNNIEVLPLSGFDNRIRLAEYRAIYSSPGFERYFQANPPIHILVKNGHVKLVGVVANQFDKNIAGIRANGVSGVFSVENDLRVERG